MLRNNNARSLDMDDVIERAKNQYVEMANRSREQTEHWHKQKVRSTKSQQYEPKLYDLLIFFSYHLL